eukprot:1717223-Rhodomonas_salina.2
MPTRTAYTMSVPGIALQGSKQIQPYEPFSTAMSVSGIMIACRRDQPRHYDLALGVRPVSPAMAKPLPVPPWYHQTLAQRQRAESREL